MDEEKENVRIGVYLPADLLGRCDALRPTTDARSRSEFICNALEWYLGWLTTQDAGKVLTPALESVIGAKLRAVENRLSRLMFKQGVEIAMIMHILAANCEIDRSKLDPLRGLCVRELSRTNGQYKLEDALDFQEGG